MSFTQGQLDALDAAIASGVRSVTYDGHRTEYNSIDEMLRARQHMVSQMQASAGRRVTHFNPVYDKGL